MLNDSWLRKTMSVPQPLEPQSKQELSAEHEAAVRATLAQQLSSAFWVMAEPKQAPSDETKSRH
jgi:hypothetical protein